jgi:hypothetical protein
MPSLEGRQDAAVDLAIAASRLRDCDDALVAFGREARESGYPNYELRDEAVRLCERVGIAYGEMREAEKKWEEQTT